MRHRSSAASMVCYAVCNEPFDCLSAYIVYKHILVVYLSKYCNLKQQLMSILPIRTQALYVTAAMQVGCICIQMWCLQDILLLAQLSNPGKPSTDLQLSTGYLPDATDITQWQRPLFE